MKLSKLLDILPALTALADCKIPARIGYRIAKALSIVRHEVQLYDTQRIKLAGELGVLSNDGQLFSFSKEAGEQFGDQLRELLDEDVDVSLPTIGIDDLGDVAIEPAHLLSLDGVIVI